MNTEGTLWMGDIEPWMNETFIIDSFAESGFKPKSVKLIIDKRTNKFKNFCFVSFNNLKEANEALFNLNAKQIPKTNMFFKLNLTKNNPKNNKNAYVGNLPRKINDIEFYNFFKSKYPSVYYASIITDNGISRGYGFVHFSNEEEYYKCLKEMDGTLFHNKIINVKERRNTDEQMNNKYNNINLLPYINNYINIFYQQQMKKEEEISAIDNDETTSTSQDKEKDLSYLSFNDRNNTFSDNIDLLKNNNSEKLYSKIQESVDKIFEYYKNSKNINEISQSVYYYGSNCIYQK